MAGSCARTSRPPLGWPGPDGPVRPRPGEDDADGVFTVGLGERPEEVVDGPPPHPLFLDGLQDEPAVGREEVLVGGDDVDVARLDVHGLRDLRDRGQVALEHVGEVALLVGLEVEDDHEGDAVRLGEPGKERL